MMPNGLPVVALLLPLALDTFVLAAALGVAGLPRRERLRVSLILSSFEAGMPVVGFFAGSMLGQFLGRLAGFTGIGFLAFAGALLLWPSGDDKEKRRLQLLAKVRGLAIFDLGLSISVDELTIGFSLGLLGLALAFTIAWIAVQAFVAAQLGLWLGSRLSEAARERAEKLAGILLVAMAVVLLILKLRNF